MATLLGGNEGSLNSGTDVEIVPAPAAGVQRMIRSIHFDNVDTALVTIRVYKVKTGTSRRFVTRPVEVNGVFDAVDDLDIIVLDDDDESVTADLSGAPATTQPTFTASWRDETLN